MTCFGLLLECNDANSKPLMMAFDFENATPVVLPTVKV